MAEHLYCPVCGSKVRAEYVDVGIGMVQVEPHYCSNCDWVEGGCKGEECGGERCTAWDYCQGRSIKRNDVPIRNPKELLWTRRSGLQTSQKIQLQDSKA